MISEVYRKTKKFNIKIFLARYLKNMTGGVSYVDF